MLSGRRLAVGPVSLLGDSSRLDTHGDRKSDQNRKQHSGEARSGFVPLHELADPIAGARRARHDRLIMQEALYVQGQPVRRLIATRAVLLHRLHRDPVQITFQGTAQ